MAFTAIQVLELRLECRIVSLGICGAFNSFWWAGLLKHLWSVGLRGKAYGLLSSYLYNRRLFVVILPLNRTLKLVFLRVESGPLYCLICTFVTLVGKF